MTRFRLLLQIGGDYLFPLIGVFAVAIVVRYPITVPAAFPRSVMIVTCALLIAGPALPQFGIALSRGVIPRILIPTFYRSHLYPFVVFQTAIVLMCFLTECLHDPVKNAMPLTWNVVIALALVDVLYVPFYMTRFIRKLLQPEELIQLLVDRQQGRWTPRKPAYRQHLRRLRLWFGQLVEQSASPPDSSSDRRDPLKIIEQIAIETADPNEKFALLNAMVRIRQDIILRYEHIRQDQRRLAQDSAAYVKMMGRLAECVRDVTTNPQRAADEKNTKRGIRFIRDCWSLTREWRDESYDWQVYSRVLRDIGCFSAARGYLNAAHDSVKGLESIVDEGIACERETRGDRRQRVSTTSAAGDIVLVGKAAVSAGHLDAAWGHLNDLRAFVARSEQPTSENLMFDTLYLASVIYESDRWALPRLRRLMDQKPTSQWVEGAKQYGKQNYPCEYRHVEAFLNAETDRPA
jgi:hypothetical protein